MQLTSLGGARAEGHVDPGDYHWYLAFEPMPSLAFDRPSLQLVKGARLRKSGYLKVRDSYLVHWTMLRRYDSRKPADHYRLTAESFNVVADIMGFEKIEDTISTKTGPDTPEWKNAHFIDTDLTSKSPVSNVPSQSQPPMTADVSSSSLATAIKSHNVVASNPTRPASPAKEVILPLSISCKTLAQCMMPTIVCCFLLLLGRKIPSSD